VHSHASFFVDLLMMSNFQVESIYTLMHPLCCECALASVVCSACRLALADALRSASQDAQSSNCGCPSIPPRTHASATKATSARCSPPADSGEPCRFMQHSRHAEPVTVLLHCCAVFTFCEFPRSVNCTEACALTVLLHALVLIAPCEAGSCASTARAQPSASSSHKPPKRQRRAAATLRRLQFASHFCARLSSLHFVDFFSV
jgi:hypothetical protein